MKTNFRIPVLRIFVGLLLAGAAGACVVAAATSGETTDVEATIHQSTVDKVLDSITYPYTAVDGPTGGDWGCLGAKETSKLIRRLNSKLSAEYSADEVK